MILIILSLSVYVVSTLLGLARVVHTPPRVYEAVKKSARDYGEGYLAKTMHMSGTLTLVLGLGATVPLLVYNFMVTSLPTPLLILVGFYVGYILREVYELWKAKNKVKEEILNDLLSKAMQFEYFRKYTLVFYGEIIFLFLLRFFTIIYLITLF